MFFWGCHIKTWGCSSKTWQPYPSSYITFNLLSKRMESWSFQKTVEVFGVIKNWLNSTLVRKKFSPEMKSLSLLNAWVTSNKMVKNKPFSGTVFNTLWHGLLRVVAQKTTFWLAEIFGQPTRSFYSMVFEVVFDATICNKMKHIMKGYGKIVPENDVFSCVPFCLRSLGRLKICAIKSTWYYHQCFSKPPWKYFWPK